MKQRRVIKFGVIGCGLMGREFASAAARWCHLSEMNVEPRIVAVCDSQPAATTWFADRLPGIQSTTTDYRSLLDNDEIDAIYCAVPHNLHSQLYCDIIASGKHLLGEKPFGIDQPASDEIQAAIAAHPNVLVRCASEMPYFPGAYQIVRWIEEGRFGRIIEVNAGFWHSSDLDPLKPINWKRQVAMNGAYGCLGDLGMHVLHVPLRSGWMPANVRALLSKIMTERPGPGGAMVPCETWDNAILACEVKTDDQEFPMVLSTKRIAPGHANTWFLEVTGTDFSARFSTQQPKQVWSLPYTSGGPQAWHVIDVPHRSAYPVITGGIFEFGFSDSILQMWAAFCDELHNGRARMQQPLYCATPEEAAQSHVLFTAALESHSRSATIAVDETPSAVR